MIMENLVTMEKNPKFYNM